MLLQQTFTERKCASTLIRRGEIDKSLIGTKCCCSVFKKVLNSKVELSLQVNVDRQDLWEIATSVFFWCNATQGIECQSKLSAMTSTGWTARQKIAGSNYF